MQLNYYCNKISTKVIFDTYIQLASYFGNTIVFFPKYFRHPYPEINVHYKYRFYAPNNTFEVSYVDFTTEKLENYNWNYLDHYICTRGDKDFSLTDVNRLKKFPNLT